MTEEEAKRAEQAALLMEAYRSVFSTPQGELVLSHLAKIGHVADTTFVQGAPDISAFNEGRRHLVLSIIRNANRDPFVIAQRLLENR